MRLRGLAILTVLWKRGPQTVRDVHEALRSSQDTGYTTVLKFLQIMTGKGLVTRDDAQRTHIYAASLPEEETQRQLVTDLLDRAFRGSAKNLVLHALSTRKSSSAELAEIRKLLDEMSKGAR